MSIQSAIPPPPCSPVGPKQINGQVFYESATTGATAQVIANGISAAQVPFVISPVAPRILIGQGSACLAQNEDGTLNSASNPVKAGRYFGAYLIGLGAVNPYVEAGAPARTVPLSIPPGVVSSSLGGRRIIPTYVGLIPGYVGLGEVDLLVPLDLPVGIQNFSVTVGNVTNNACQIAVGK